MPCDKQEEFILILAFRAAFLIKEFLLSTKKVFGILCMN